MMGPILPMDNSIGHLYEWKRNLQSTECHFRYTGCEFDVTVIDIAATFNPVKYPIAWESTQDSVNKDAVFFNCRSEFSKSAQKEKYSLWNAYEENGGCRIKFPNYNTFG